jgi:hypothetical protein
MTTTQQLKITKHGTFRGQVVHLGPPSDEDRGSADRPPGEGSRGHAVVDGEPLMAVTVLMPLEDARRAGALLYQWVELSVTSAGPGGGSE